MKILTFAVVMVAVFLGGASADEIKLVKPGNNGLVPGLVASFRDDVRSVSEVVMLPELGLAVEETPHPAIKPTFTVSYDGFIQVAQAGRYQFETKGTLVIGGEVVTGERKLDAGQHALRLTYQRPAGEVRFGLSWQSDQFVKEPVPPTTLWHTAGAAPSAPTAYGKDSLPSPPARIRNTLASMKCASCHDAVFLGTMHHKFKPESLMPLMRHASPLKWYGAMTGPLLDESETSFFQH